MRIAVLGAGASGMMAGLQAAWNGGAVTLFERNPIAGRKLLVTGSGRCNITNAAAAAAVYACADQAWMETLLGQFGVAQLLGVLAEIGVPVYQTSDGWYYPLSDSAHTVVDAFACALQLAGATLTPSTQVLSIRSAHQGFAVRYSRDGHEAENEFDRVIVATGGKAYPSLGSRGELFDLLERLGHRVLPKRPALAPVLADLGFLQALQGVRLNVGATLWHGSQRLAATSGNLIFTQWGLNGPVVMDLSHHVSAHPQDRLSLSLNLLALFAAEFDGLLAQKRQSSMPLRVFLGAFFPPKVALCYIQHARLPDEILMRQVNDAELERLIQELKDTRLAVKGVRDFEYCQVSAGGVQVSEVDPHTLESRRLKGMYLTGETLDVVGPCGGYNLQYAFSSGAVAGMAAAGGRNSAPLLKTGEF